MPLGPARGTPMVGSAPGGTRSAGAGVGTVGAMVGTAGGLDGGGPLGRSPSGRSCGGSGNVVVGAGGIGTATCWLAGGCDRWVPVAAGATASVAAATTAPTRRASADAPGANAAVVTCA